MDSDQPFDRLAERIDTGFKPLKEDFMDSDQPFDRLAERIDTGFKPLKEHRADQSPKIPSCTMQIRVWGFPLLVSMDIIP
jgi:hypothetical protein